MYLLKKCISNGICFILLMILNVCVRVCSFMCMYMRVCMSESMCVTVGFFLLNTE